MLTSFFVRRGALGGAESVAGPARSDAAAHPAGITPVAANATSTLAMAGSVSSAFAYRREITTTTIRWSSAVSAWSAAGAPSGSHVGPASCACSRGDAVRGDATRRALRVDAGSRRARVLPAGSCVVISITALLAAEWG